MEEFNESDIQFHHPFRILAAAASGCGKSFWCKRFLDNLSTLTETKFDKIIYVYHTHQPLYEEIKREHPNIIWIRGLEEDTLETCTANRSQLKLIVFDDLMPTISNSKDFAELATTLSHHMNVSYILTLQNLLYQGTQSRTIHLQCTAYVLFKSPRDVTQVKVLANQLGIMSPQFVKRVHREATRDKFQYLVIDLHISTPDSLRLRSGIFPGEKLTIYQE